MSFSELAINNRETGIKMYQVFILLSPSENEVTIFDINHKV